MYVVALALEELHLEPDHVHRYHVENAVIRFSTANTGHRQVLIMYHRVAFLGQATRFIKALTCLIKLIFIQRMS